MTVQTQDGMLEALFHPGLLKLTAELLEEQRRTTAELRALVDRMQALGSALASMAALREVDQGRPALPTPELSLPVSLKTINEHMLSVRLGGYLLARMWSIYFLVPAGEVATLVLPVYPGYVATFNGPVNYGSTYYSTGIEVVIKVDGDPITEGAYPEVLSCSGSFTLGQYAHAWRQMELIFTNKTTIDATFFAVGETIYIERNFYQLFYLPLLQFGYDVLKNLAMLANGGRPIP